MPQPDIDVLLLGGGLSASLLAYRLAVARPELRVTILERGERLGGNHTWSFHLSDVTATQREWLKPFVAHAWPAQAVSFPGFTRELKTGYASVTSERLHEVVAATRVATRFGAVVARVEEDAVTLRGGERIGARCVIDCRGAASTRALQIAFQKFLGVEFTTARPHGLANPVIMDATVSQTDGYRFVYVLPLAPDRLLVEDTYYSDGAPLDPDMLRKRVFSYAESKGWAVAGAVREEQGVLPIILGGDIDAFWRERRRESPAAQAGLRSALFHPTTGYSLPDAAAVADEVCAMIDLTTASVARAIEARSKRAWSERRFFRLLNRMLFIAAEPGRRWRVLERFYRFSPDLIERFYGARLTNFDKTRIVAGKSPLNFFRGLECLSESWSIRRSGLSWDWPEHRPSAAERETLRP